MLPAELLHENMFKNGMSGLSYYGYPAPIVTRFVNSFHGEALDNNGDGSYESVAYSTEPIARDDEEFYFEFKAVQYPGSTWDFMYVGLGNKPTTQQSFPKNEYRAGIMGNRPNGRSNMSMNIYLYDKIRSNDGVSWNVFGFHNRIIENQKRVVDIYMNGELQTSTPELDIYGSDLYFVDTGRSYHDTGRVSYYRVWNMLPDYENTEIYNKLSADKLIAIDTFDENADGWNVTSRTSNPSYGNFLGRFGGNGGHQGYYKTYSTGMPNSLVRIKIDIAAIDSWDSKMSIYGHDSLHVFINDSVAFVRDKTYEDVDDAVVVAQNKTEVIAVPASYYGWTDHIIRFDFVAMTNDNGDIKIGFGSRINQAMNDESWGICEVGIYG
jgi:hypothetical protein